MISMNKNVPFCVCCKKFDKCQNHRCHYSCFEYGRSNQEYPCNTCNGTNKDDGSCASSCSRWWAWILGNHGWDAIREQAKGE